MKIQITEEEKDDWKIWEFIRYVKKQYNLKEEMKVSIVDDENRIIAVSVEELPPDEEIPF